jgi:hypothetical protein
VHHPPQKNQADRELFPATTAPSKTQAPGLGLFVIEPNGAKSAELQDVFTGQSSLRIVDNPYPATLFTISAKSIAGQGLSAIRQP